MVLKKQKSKVQRKQKGGQTVPSMMVGMDPPPVMQPMIAMQSMEATPTMPAMMSGMMPPSMTGAMKMQGGYKKKSSHKRSSKSHQKKTRKHKSRKSRKNLTPKKH